MKRYTAFEYYVRTAVLLIETMVFAIAFLVHRFVSGDVQVTYRYTKRWCRMLLRVAGVRIVVKGEENISPDGTYIFISNHASQFDIPSIIVATPLDIRIMYKRELQKIPFMGWAMKYSTFVPVTRTDARDAMNSIDETVADIQRHSASVSVFAEGTRTKDGNLQQFKRGAFVMAIKSGKPIVPVAICGSREVLPTNSMRFNGGTITVKYGKPIEVSGKEFTRQDEKDLVERVRNEVAQMLNEVA